MKINYKIWSLLVALLMIASQVGFAFAYGETAQYVDTNRLTSEQMENAIVVNDGSFESRANETGPVYRLANCDDKSSDSPCYFTITGSSKEVVGSEENLLSTNATISCGIDVYSHWGTRVARLKERVNVTFYGTYGRTPVTLNWGDLQGTATYAPFYSWSTLTGPTPNPAWGVYVSSSGTAYATAGGLLLYSPPPPLSGQQVYVSTVLTINSSGWSCS